MASGMVCVRCGKTLDAGETTRPETPGERLCEGCAGWQRARATDHDDQYHNPGLDVLTPAPRPIPTGRRIPSH